MFYIKGMQPRILLFYLFLGLSSAFAASKPHSITYGKWTTVQWFTGNDGKHAQEIRIRPLFVDSKLREFTLGEPHDVTDRIFVLRRAFRVNDWLPDDPKSVPKWKWQRGGWLLVDRLTGHISNLNLPEFDPFYSAASWYRDYVAYCGVSSDAEKAYAVVAEIGRKKPLLRKEMGAFKDSAVPDSECPAPKWQRAPARVSFQPQGSAPLTFEIHGAAAEIAAPESENKSEQ